MLTICYKCVKVSYKSKIFKKENLMRHTVTRILPEAYSRLAAIKDKYPAMSHTALVGEDTQPLHRLTLSRTLQRVLRLSVSP